MTKLKRYKGLQRTRLKRSKSPRKNIIGKVLDVIRKINNIKYSNRCFFCGRHISKLHFPLSNCHILSVGAYPRLECIIENIVPACWSKNYQYKRCHNLWERRDEKWRPIMEEQLKAVFGNDYKVKLLIMNKTLPPLNRFRAEGYLLHYKQELKRLENL